MVFPVVGGNESKGYEISNSIRFNDGDSPKLTRTNASGGDRQKFTISFWTKRTTIGATHIFFDAGTSTSTDSGSFSCSINSSDKLFIGGGATSFRQTNRLFRDVSAWYHIVIAVDTTDSTADDRIKIYVNGVQETSFTTNNAISLNQNTPVNESSKVHQICNRQKSSSLPFDGYMTEFHFIDGAQKAQTDFGEFDDNGVWIPKKYTGTYGTNGFFLQFKQTGTSANSSGIGADTSGNDNHFTPTNLAATDITEDTCTNNFCTWNPLDTHSGNTFSEGNLKVNGAASARLCSTTFAPSQGKWYQEFKLTDVNSGSIYNVEQGALALSGNLFVSGSDNTGIYFTGPSVYRNGSNQGSITGGFSDDDILQIALDLDNNNVYYGKNGNWSDGVGGGFDQSDFSNASGFALTRTTSNNNITFSTQNGASSSAFELIANWGNPPYSVSSSNNDGKYGNFEYAVPSGYYALCTKRLAEFG
jgi:hypothetical protein